MKLVYQEMTFFPLRSYKIIGILGFRRCIVNFIQIINIVQGFTFGLNDERVSICTTVIHVKFIH